MRKNVSPIFVFFVAFFNLLVYTGIVRLHFRVEVIKMASLANVIFCMQAETVPSGNVNAMNVMSTLSPEYIPGLFTFSIIVSILGIKKEEGHTFSVFLIDPNGTRIVEIKEEKLPVIDDVSNIPDEYKGINISMSLNNVNFRVSGEYSMEIFYDNEKLGEHRIYVKGKNEP